MENIGAELVKRRIVVTKDWHWRLGYNLTFNKNKITRHCGEPPIAKFPMQLGYCRYHIGDYSIQQRRYPINSFYVFQQIYDKNGKPIEKGYVDRTTTRINSADSIL